MSTGKGEDAAPERPLLRIVKGNPSDEEVAALVAVLHTAAAAGATPPPRKAASEWSAPHRRLRAAVPSGPGAWRASALPR